MSIFAAHAYEDDTTARCADILANAMANLQMTYHLSYVDYRDELDDDQLAELLAGNVQDVEETLWENWSESEADASYDAAFEAIGDQDDVDYLREHDEDLFEELRFAIHERDDSDVLGELLRHAGSKLLRYRLDYEVPATAGMDDDELDEVIGEIANAVGVDVDANRNSIRAILAECAYNNGTLWFMWYGDISDVVDAVTAKQWQDIDSTITFTDPTLLVLDAWNGSGMDGQTTGTVTLPFTIGDAVLDSKACGYGWNAIAGVYAPAYASSVVITEVPSCDQVPA